MMTMSMIAVVSRSSRKLHGKFSLIDLAG